LQDSGVEKNELTINCNPSSCTDSPVPPPPIRSTPALSSSSPRCPNPGRPPPGNDRAEAAYTHSKKKFDFEREEFGFGWGEGDYGGVGQRQGPRSGGRVQRLHRRQLHPQEDRTPARRQGRRTRRSENAQHLYYSNTVLGLGSVGISQEEEGSSSSPRAF
jgi:hypothetical protein